MATDPICGMTVNEATALSAEAGGTTHYFCSEHCRAKFLAQQTVPQAGVTHSHHHNDKRPPAHGHKHGLDKETIYTCPMHPEVRQTGPGTCPKCGMALEPENVTLEEDDSELGDMTRRF